MTNQTQDPISQIKKEEAQAKKKLETKLEKANKDLAEFEIELIKKTKDFEDKLRKKGNEKLATVKKEAGETFKSKMATSEKEKNQTTTKAKENQKKAVEICVNEFMSYIKTS